MNPSWRPFAVLAACLLVVSVHARAPEPGHAVGIGELLNRTLLVVSRAAAVPAKWFFHRVCFLRFRASLPTAGRLWAFPTVALRCWIRACGRFGADRTLGITCKHSRFLPTERKSRWLPLTLGPLDGPRPPGGFSQSHSPGGKVISEGFPTPERRTNLSQSVGTRRGSGWCSQRLVFNDKGAIRITDVESGATRVIGVGLSPTWSPDGPWIAYRTGEGRLR
jgi:hypothetical protein